MADTVHTTAEVILHHGTDHRLAGVMSEMCTLGAPVVRVFCLSPGRFLATEGVHRLTAAHALGVIPMLEVMREDCFANPWYNVTVDDVLAGQITIGEMHDTFIEHMVENEGELPILIFARVALRAYAP